MRLIDAPKLRLGSPSIERREGVVAILLTLPMGWKNSPPIFCMATETVAYLANVYLRCNHPSYKHKLDDYAEALVIPGSPPLQESLAGLSRNPYLSHNNVNPTSYVNVFVDEFWSLAQGPTHRRRHARRTLFHALDKVLRPLDPTYTANQK